MRRIHSMAWLVTAWLHDPDLRPAWVDELRPTVVIGAHSFFYGAMIGEFDVAT